MSRTGDANDLTHIDRRTTLRWLASALGAGALAGCGSEDRAAVRTVRDVADLGTPKPITGTGYGRYPDTQNPTVTWERTMTKAQLRLTRALADLVIPADTHPSGARSPSAGEIGVQDFIDEWVSAPYGGQQADRALIFEGLTWLEQEAMDRTGGARFIDAGDRTRRAILDDIAYKDQVKPGLESQAAFFVRLRDLLMSAYYATRAGEADIGYLGNVPSGGPYPGPTQEAMDHLEAGLKRLGLPMPALAAAVPSGD